MNTLRATLAAFRPTEPEPMEIILNGRNLGTVEPSRHHGEGPYRWHASFRPEVGTLSSLIQGFGATPEEAIADGFVRTREELEKSLLLISELKEAMYSE